MGISQDRLKELLSYDPLTGIFHWIKLPVANQVKVGDIAGFTTSYGYKTIIIDNNRYQAHHMAWLYMTGIMPEMMDHKDHNRSNNIFKNLRVVTRLENNRNYSKYKSNKSGETCIFYEKDRNRYAVNVSRKRIGRFKTMAEAIIARDKAWKDDGYHPNHGK